MSHFIKSIMTAGLIIAAAGTAQAAPVFYSVTGADAASITPTVDAFRAALGALNANVPGSFGSGRREINWDGVPDIFAAPNALPADFFNVNSPRGVVFNTPGSGFQVSANAVNPTGTPIEFGNLDAALPDEFTTFSAQRLFTAVDSNITDVHFFIPGSTTPAVTMGFGAVFTDVDVSDLTSIEYYDINDNLLATISADGLPGSETLSFIGVTFDTPSVARVRITSGGCALGDTCEDEVAMDDFIYGEPVSVPEPAAAAIFLTGVVAAGAALQRRR